MLSAFLQEQIDAIRDEDAEGTGQNRLIGRGR